MKISVRSHVATVLTACGIETVPIYLAIVLACNNGVATVLTACGIETYT